MKPKIIQNSDFIEVIGHYDNEVQCAKMTLLAELYAIEHRDGYAKFPLDAADKLGLVDSKLEFKGTTYIYSNDGQTKLFEKDFLNGTALITSTGVDFPDGSDYVYSGDKTFLGLSRTTNAVSPDADLAVGMGIEGSPGANRYFYIVEGEPQPTGYSVTYHANDGIPTPQNLTNQTELPTLPIVSKSNYNFIGWYYDSTFTQEAHAGDTLSGNVDLYAKFVSAVITLDLSTLNLPEGTHSIQIRLSDNGVTKRDSELSNAVSYVVYPTYTITPTLTNVVGDSSNPTTIQGGSTATLHFTASSGYALPDSVTVTGATSNWNKSTGTLTLSNPTGNVTFSIVGEQAGGYDFANDSWATIASQIKAGTDHYNLGDTKTDSITISGTQYDGTYNVTFKIVDNLVGRYTTQSGQSHKVIEIQEIFGQNYNGGVIWNNNGTDPMPGPPMPPDPYPATSFRDSVIIKRLNEVIVNFLPSELRAVLETTTVYSGDGTQEASSSTNVAATCKLFVASFNEYYGASDTYGWANNTETNGKGQFTWYQQAGVTTSNYGDMIKYKVEDGSTAYYYWTRSPYGSSRFGGFAVGVTGDGSYLGVNVLSGFSRVAPCFAW